jgi:hypothetical protein
MKARFLVFASVAIWVTALGWMSAAPRDRDDEDKLDISAAEAARIVQGYTIAPVPLNLQGRNPVLVGLGSYLVSAVATIATRTLRTSSAAIRRWASRNESTGSTIWRAGPPSDRSSRGT